jgi:radical SAM protein
MGGAGAGDRRVTDTRETAGARRAANDRKLPRIDLNQSPFTIAWEITRACALACLHCRAEAQPKRDPRELTTEEALKVIDQVRAVGDPILVVTGGDPLRRPDVYELLAYSVSVGLRTSLAPTASALVTPRNLARVRDAGVRRVGISLDGATAAVHDRFRGFAGSFKRTMEITQRIADAGLALQVNTTVTRHNLAALKEMPELIAAAGAVQWSVFFLVPTGRGRAEDMISPQQHEDVYNWLCDISRTAPFDVKTTAGPAYRRVAIQRARAGVGEDHVAGAGYRFQDGLDRPMIGINDGSGFAFISHTGDVYPSGFLPLAGGNVRKMPLTEIYRNTRLFRELRNPDLLKGKCGECDFRTVCGGSRARAYGVTGDYLAPDPSCAYEPVIDGDIAPPNGAAEGARR